MAPVIGAGRMRLVGLFVAVVALGVLLVAGCAGPGQDQSKAAPVAGSFVGQAGPSANKTPTLPSWPLPPTWEKKNVR
jgi:hypothetical protein